MSRKATRKSKASKRARRKPRRRCTPPGHNGRATRAAKRPRDVLDLQHDDRGFIAPSQADLDEVNKTRPGLTPHLRHRVAQLNALQRAMEPFGAIDGRGECGPGVSPADRKRAIAQLLREMAVLQLQRTTACPRANNCEPQPGMLVRPAWCDAKTLPPTGHGCRTLGAQTFARCVALLAKLPKLNAVRNEQVPTTARVAILAEGRFFYAIEANPSEVVFYGHSTMKEGAPPENDADWGLFELATDLISGQVFVRQIDVDSREIEGTPYSVARGSLVCAAWSETRADAVAANQDTPHAHVGVGEQPKTPSVTVGEIWEMLSTLPSVGELEATGMKPTKAVKLKAADRVIWVFEANRHQHRLYGAWCDGNGGLPPYPVGWFDFILTGTSADKNSPQIIPVTDDFIEAYKKNMEQRGQPLAAQGARVEGAWVGDIDATASDHTLLN